MMNDATPLAPLPFHILARTDSEIVLTRGMVCVCITAEKALDCMRFVCDYLAVATPTRQELLEAAPMTLRDKVSEILDLLLERRLVIDARSNHPQLPVLESPLDVFNWHFARDILLPNHGLEHTRVAVVGYNDITRTLLPSLAAAGFADVTLIDDPFLRRGPTRDEDERVSVVEPTEWIRDELRTTDIVVACSDSGSISILREWNALCVGKKVRFLPVLLRRMVGLVGPLVLPGDTACFECKVRREPDGPELATDIEALEAEAARGEVAAFHPSMSGVVAHFAVMELVKFFGNVPAMTAGVLFDINLLRPELVSRRILKLPGCPVCSTINRVPAYCVVDVARGR